MQCASWKNRMHPTRHTVTAASSEHQRTSDSVSADQLFLGLRPQCPRCRATLDKLECDFCGLRMPVNNGIVYALPPDRASYYARFIEDYERIRSAEGRWSRKDDFYLRLPYADLSGRNSNQWKIRALSYDYLMERVLKQNRR